MTRKLPSHRRSTTSRRSIAAQATELAFAAPQVVAHRLGRMAAAGASPSSRDRREFVRMVLEKQTAAGQSFVAMAAQGWLGAPLIAASMMRAACVPWFGLYGQHPVAAQVQDTAERVLARGLAPVHRAAVANARRLGRQSRRTRK